MRSKQARRLAARNRIEDGILGDGKPAQAGRKNRRKSARQSNRADNPGNNRKNRRRGDDNSSNIDAEGFRPNVGIIVLNARGQALWARRVGGKDAWQFPQGGINPGETAEQALYRELYEEIGLTREQVSLIACTRGWLRYRLPQRLIRRRSEPLCIGQKQKWYLLKLETEESAISFNNGYKPEFDHWRWVSYWHPLSKVVTFKREVYRRALTELAPQQIQLERRWLRDQG
ncbi:putative (di)nucleoside polyphosphate hydrolase [Microbulbifer donghaiensis]|uniref:RNA pyrophosphohydrolase n=1 Tax=Microbulbifer donghaiensis TaxID=494016 RepID=A0A1M5F4Q8_9GAMM|nr:RNA pyrophosphohydrolase [Microbulbifer donghaiensis]SHF86507.1 putative (di)nucleoside polyphosphate hydrolase [Microbulbifer donghaiensis]